MFKERLISLLIILTLCLLVTGCVSGTKNISITSTAQPRPNASATDVPFLISTALPSSPYSNAPATPTVTFLSTKIPPTAPANLPATWTPLPSLQPDKAQETVMELYENNPCELPCWWGIEPGKTDWREAWQFLGQFTTNQSPWETLLKESESLPGYMYYRVYLNVPQSDDDKYYSPLNDLSFMINIETFTVDYIDVNTGNIQNYTIPKIIKTYGYPEKSYISIADTSMSQFSGVYLVMYYPQHGFISNHFAKVDKDEFGKSEIRACFQKYATLYLWSSEQEMDFHTRLSSISLIDSRTLSFLQPFEQVTTSSLEEIIDVMQDEEQFCITLKNE